MSGIARIYRRFVPQLLYVVVLPVFFIAFMLIYRPFNIIGLLGNEWFGVHITIISCIILLSVIITRTLYYYLPLKLTYTLYATWCLAEIIFMSFFAALYVWLVLHKPMPYFDAFRITFRYISLTLVLPYVIMSLALRIHEYNLKSEISNDNILQRMRFYDEKHNLKIVLEASSVLYIEADVNYVHIFYLQNDRVRSYVLRSSMKAIEELCQDNGLVRCQRSFYVNPKHIKVLRKEKEGVIYAELDALDTRHIPVTKRYYDKLAEMLY